MLNETNLNKESRSFYSGRKQSPTPFALSHEIFAMDTSRQVLRGLDQGILGGGGVPPMLVGTS